MDFGRHMEVASLEATEEIMAVASFPQAPNVSTTIAMTHTHPRSEHLRSLVWCFLDSVAWAAAVADTPASNKITGFSGEVMDTCCCSAQKPVRKYVSWTGLTVVST